MSELDETIAAVDRDVAHKHGSAAKGSRSPLRVPSSMMYILLAVLAVLLFIQLQSMTSWIFGVPEDSVQADIVTVLESTDKKLQRYDGAYPELLPADTPRWLLGYKKTLAGYQISAEIDGVTVELSRNGTDVQIRRLDSDTEIK